MGTGIGAGPLCYKQTRPGTNGYCDCSSAVSRSPPFGSPSSVNTVPVVRSSYWARDSCARLPGSVTYFAACDEPVKVLLREVEVHKGLDSLVVLERVGAHVDEQRAGEQILTGANAVLGGLDAVHERAA